MPLPNEHSCRILDPAGFQKGSFRRIKESSAGKTLWMIIGHLKGKTKTTLQAYRYPKDGWSAAQARTHCKDHKGSFTAAGETDSMPQIDARTDKNAPANDGRERRFIADCELRVLDADEAANSPGKLVGYAAVFDSLSEKIFGFYEKIAKGAFADSLKRGDDVRALVEHEGGLSTLGRTSAETLELKEDSHGLYATIFPPDTQAGRDVVKLVKRGDLTQMSFGFRVPKGGDDWIDGKDGDADVRILTKVDLFDVSVVAIPAYSDTDVTVASRSREAWLRCRTSQTADVTGRWRNIHLTRAKRRLRLGR